MENKILRIAIYIRVSTEEQAKHGYSIDSQRTRLLDWSKEHKYQVVDIYADEGKSARTKLSNRKELIRLLDDVKNNKIDRIVIWRLDRWFRNVADYYRIQDILDKHHVDWECSDEDFNTSTSNGRLYLNIKLSIAQNESDQTSDRIKFNFENMVKNKRPITGRFSVGYMVGGEKQNKRVIKNLEHKDYVKDMFDKFEECVSLHKTLVFLREKYPEISIGSKQLRNNLLNPLYAGRYRDVVDYCEPYITMERHERICKLIKSKNVKQYPRSSHTYLFTGLMRCFECKRRMSGSIQKKKHVDGTLHIFGMYRCHIHTNECKCDNCHTTNENKLENWLINNFLVKLNDFVISINGIKDREEIKSNEKRINDLSNKLSRLNELYIEGRISKEKYDVSYTSCVDELKKLKSKCIISTKNLDEYKELIEKSNITDIYFKLDREHRKIFWATYIDWIEQDPENPNDNFIIFFK